MTASPFRLFVVMGVSGCGKSSVGTALAERIGGTYFEGDDLHPQTNIDLMRAGTPLTDEDRWPWLAKIAQAMASKNGIVFVGCSALKVSYRSFLIKNAKEPIFFIHLSGSRELIAERMNKRKGHFMPPDLLNSQFATLEPPSSDEAHITADISLTENEIVESIMAAMPDTLDTNKLGT